MHPADELQIRFWGVRGSRPVPGPNTAKTGGNTSCVEVRAGSRHVIFDAGTGIVPCGERLVRTATGGEVDIFDAGTGIVACGERLVRAAAVGEVDIFLSHLHHDHLEGLRFFPPLYRPGWRSRVYGPQTAEGDFAARVGATMGGYLFPVATDDLRGTLELHGLDTQAQVALGGTPPLTVESLHCRAHPTFGVRLYRLRFGRRLVVYATDVEAPDGGFDDVVRFAAGADVLIHDAQYTEREYHRASDGRRGWGHSTVRMAAEAARAAGVGRLLLYHHDPERHDRDIGAIERTARKIFRRSKAAREGLSIRVGEA